MKSATKKTWELRPFPSKDNAAWKTALVAKQKELKRKKRVHPAIFMLGAVGKHLYETSKAMYGKKWDLRAFSKKDNAIWKAAVVAAQKELKKKKRVHPALFMVGTVGKHLYEAS